MKLIITFITFFLLLHININAQIVKTYSIIYLNSGDKIIVPKEKEINEDWKKDLSIRKKVKQQMVTDFLDGRAGFSIEEKGYWLSFFGQSKQMEKLSEGNKKKLILYQIYYLQGVLLRAETYVKDRLLEKLKKTISQLDPLKIDHQDIWNIRLVSCKSFLASHTQGLEDREGKNILANFYINYSSENRDKVLAYYRKKLHEIESSVFKLQSFLHDKDKLLKKKAGEKSRQAIADLEKAKRDIVNHLIVQSDIFFSLIIRADRRNISALAITIKQTFVVNLKAKYPIADKLKI